MILRGTILGRRGQGPGLQHGGPWRSPIPQLCLGRGGVCLPLAFTTQVHGSGGLERELEPILSAANPAVPDLALSGPPFRYKLGCNVRLTIDSRLQTLAHELLEGRSGAAVLLDIKTGGHGRSRRASGFGP